ncbi:MULTISPECIES: alpha/beta hydrolase [Novosphingobium]|jgi:pimeloyl-ACP methyl ester carboxylesterase|uniref:alpha/beta hydrolase n=1 Tax=Novosphingobium TaxID=165696 RepID=UPI0022F290B2|nr:alpha/beta hydrolase [Novosphingobium resinovorum]GLK46043.1 hypothetical protein GCM10017612_39630 [Novosphingobium resinovorum]
MSQSQIDGNVEIVLVHGLFIGPWAWTRVREILSSRFTVHAPQLPFASLETDAALVRELVASLNSQGRTILLVGHSYGGMVISQAGHDAAHLCYLGALLPEPGQTAADVSGICVSATCAEAMVSSDDGKWISLDSEKSVAALYHLCLPTDVAFASARHRPAPAAIFAETVQRPAWLDRPATYIVCDGDQAVAPAYQRACGQRLGSMLNVSGDHSAFFSADMEVATAIAGLASALTVPD